MKKSFYRSYGSIILLVTLAALPLIVYGANAGALSNENIVTDWLPPHFNETKRLKWFIERFGTGEMLAISWEQCNLKDERTEKLAQAIQALTIPGVDGHVAMFSEVFTGPEMLETLTVDPFNLSIRQALIRLQGWLVGPNGETCVVARLSRQGERYRHEAVDSVLELAEAKCGLSPGEVHLAGPSIDSVAIDRTSSASVQNLNVLCWGVCLAVAAVSFRSLRIGAIIFFVALICQYLSVAIIYYTGTTMNSILMMVASLVFVLSVSASVHLINYYRDAVRQDGIDEAPGGAVRVGWVPCWLAAGTTALSMASLMVSRITPIYTFGKYAAIGVISGLALLMLVLPAAIERWPMQRWAGSGPERETDTPLGGRWRGWAHMIIRLHIPIVLLGIVLLIAAGFGAARIQTTVNLHDMFDPNERVIQDYDWMQKRIGPMVPVDVVLHFPESNGGRMLERMRLVEAVAKEIRKADYVGGTITAATFGPKVPIAGSVRDIIRGALYNRELVNHREDFQKQKFLYDGDEELWRISVRVQARTRIDYGQFLDDLERRILPVIEQEEKAVASISGVHATFCGGVPLVNKAQKQLLEDLILSFATAFVLVGITMVLVLRDVCGGLVAMIPNIVPAVTVFGMMGWANVVVDIGAMMTASAALGIAVDDTLHFVIWFRRGVTKGYDRRSAVLNAFERCGTAMTQTSMICGFGLVAYSLSPFIPISRFGWLMFLMLFAALLGDLVLLPALLVSPLGRFFEVKRQTPQVPAEPTVVG